jgi:hypothetical protein
MKLVYTKQAAFVFSNAAMYKGVEMCGLLDSVSVKIRV